MKYGIISDIHGNLEALKVSLSYLEEKVEGYICAGDIVGYGPHPNECIEVVCSLKNLRVCMGNHDQAVIGKKDLNWFNRAVRKAILWTSSVLKEGNKKYLENLPQRIEEKEFTIVHGSPRDPLNEYLLRIPALRENLAFFSTPLCFIGHSHVPFYFAENSGRAKLLKRNEKIKIERGKYIINPGSVGQPRDRDPYLSCAIYTQENKEINIIRLAYNISRVQEAMQNFALPGFLIQRLSRGV